MSTHDDNVAADENTVNTPDDVQEDTGGSPATEQDTTVTKDNTSTQDSSENTAATQEENPRMSRGKTIGLFLGGIALTAGLAAGTAWFLEGPLKEHQAGSDLSQVFENRSEMVLKSTTVHDYDDATSSTPQKRLGVNGEPLDHAQFVFGASDSDDSTRQLDVTVSFGEQRSMDFLRMNSGSLQNLIVNNVANVHIHTAPSANLPFSILAPEALALAVEENPDADLWYSMMNLVALSVELADEGEQSAEVIAERIATTLQEDGFSMSSADIREGAFADWIHDASANIAGDTYGLPILTLDDERINPERVDILNPEAFSDHVWSRALEDE